MPTPFLYRRYHCALRSIFSRRGDIYLPRFAQVFCKSGDLYFVHRNVFDRILSECNPQGMPGYPFVYLAQKTCDLNPDHLYQQFNILMIRWMTYDFDLLHGLSRVDAALTLFSNGISLPATVFIKQEPTSKSKIARNIYGVSILMNLAARLLFGDYLRELSRSWDKVEHKVGIDFYTDEGLARIDAFHKFMFANCGPVPVDSDDIQGYEFQGRSWTHDLWHHCYMAHALGLPLNRMCPSTRTKNIDVRIYRLYNAYRIVEKFAVVMFSDGLVTVPPFHTILSGKYLTHIENSDTRAALGMTASPLGLSHPVDTFVFDTVVCETNGDDYAGIRGNPAFYLNLGYVITDRVPQTLDCVNFCSQKFVRRNDGTIIRIPDGLSKLFVNAITAVDHGSYVDVLMNVRQHPGYEAFKSAVDCIRDKRLALLRGESTQI